MRKTKSKASYTTKWLLRNKHLWHEENDDGLIKIVLDIKDAPKIVRERVHDINLKRLIEFCREEQEEMERKIKAKKNKKLAS